jgi:FAD/FMN-containing dehydrogenase
MQAPSSHPDISVPRLRATFDGRVIAPGDAGYDRARSVFYGSFDRRPAVIIRPADAAEVAQVVSLARETGLELTIRSGGHSLAGHGIAEGGAEHEAWLTGFTAALRQRDQGVYVGFLGDEGEARTRAAYPGRTWDRLAEIKRRYDPTNLFRFNQNIPPAIDRAGSR